MRIKFATLLLLALSFGAQAQFVLEGNQIGSTSTAFNNSTPLSTGSLALPAGTEALIAITSTEASMLLANFSVDWNTSEAFTQQSDVNESSSGATDVELAVWCLISPTITTSTADWSVTTGSIDVAWIVLLAVSNVDTTNCGTVIGELAEDIDNAASASTAVFSSAGTSGNGGIVVCSGAGDDSSPMSNDQTWTELYDTNTGGGAGNTSDLGIYVAYDTDPFATAITVTLGATDEHVCGYYSVTAAAGGTVVPQLHNHQEQMRAN